MCCVRFDVETLLVFGMHFKNAAHVMLRNDNAFKLTILLNDQVNLFDRIHRKKFNAIPSAVLSSSFSSSHSPPSFAFYVHLSMLLASQWAREKGIIFCVFDEENRTLQCAWGQNGQFKLVNGQFSSCESE